MFTEFMSTELCAHNKQFTFRQLYNILSYLRSNYTMINECITEKDYEKLKNIYSYLLNNRMYLPNDVYYFNTAGIITIVYHRNDIMIKISFNMFGDESVPYFVFLKNNDDILVNNFANALNDNMLKYISY